MMAAYKMKDDIEKVLISKAKLRRTVRRLGREISRDYKGKNLMLIGVLKGSVVTLTDIMREITIPCRADFMVVSAYRDGTTCGAIEILYDLKVDIKDYDVLIIEDIIDSGNTLSLLRDKLLERGPRSLKICTLMNKPSGREADIEADYVGVEVPKGFVVGYGLDYDEKYRNLPYIGILRKSVYSKD